MERKTAWTKERFCLLPLRPLFTIQPSRNRERWECPSLGSGPSFAGPLCSGHQQQFLCCTLRGACLACPHCADTVTIDWCPFTATPNGYCRTWSVHRGDALMLKSLSFEMKSAFAVWRFSLHYNEERFQCEGFCVTIPLVSVLHRHLIKIRHKYWNSGYMGVKLTDAVTRRHCDTLSCLCFSFIQYTIA